MQQDGLGWNGLFRGIGATLWRHGVWNAVYFGFYHSSKDILLSSTVCDMHVYNVYRYYGRTN